MYVLCIYALLMCFQINNYSDSCMGHLPLCKEKEGEEEEESATELKILPHTDCNPTASLMATAFAKASNVGKARGRNLSQLPVLSYATLLTKISTLRKFVAASMKDARRL
jgi:hypothetical protein